MGTSRGFLKILELYKIQVNVLTSFVGELLPKHFKIKFKKRC